MLTRGVRTLQGKHVSTRFCKMQVMTNNGSGRVPIAHEWLRRGDPRQGAKSSLIGHTAADTSPHTASGSVRVKSQTERETARVQVMRGIPQQDAANSGAPWPLPES